MADEDNKEIEVEENDVDTDDEQGGNDDEIIAALPEHLKKAIQKGAEAQKNAREAQKLRQRLRDAEKGGKPADTTGSTGSPETAALLARVEKAEKAAKANARRAVQKEFTLDDDQLEDLVDGLEDYDYESLAEIADRRVRLYAKGKSVSKSVDDDDDDAEETPKPVRRTPAVKGGRTGDKQTDPKADAMAGFKIGSEMNLGGLRF